LLEVPASISETSTTSGHSMWLALDVRMRAPLLCCNVSPVGTSNSQQSLLGVGNWLVLDQGPKETLVSD